MRDTIDTISELLRGRIANMAEEDETMNVVAEEEVVDADVC